MEYNDSIHGIINIPKDILSIIETRHFQRLKNIKQLGITCKTIPQADHNRFDHCIGTYHLAKKTLEALERNTKDLIIPEFYIKVVIIAALLHDIGHGPFSHTWEYICCGKYHHEENANALIDEVFKHSLLDWDVDRPYALELIKALIVGDRKCLRDKQFLFIFDIVNNKNCDVDVDKWDYLQRDYFHTSQIDTPEVHMDFEDVFLKARVSEDRSRIEYRYCDFQKIYNIFDMRTKFHIHIYRRPINVCMEKILKYVMIACENDLDRINGLKLTDIRGQHVDAFLQLIDDDVWKSLKRIKEPKEIVELIKCLNNSALCQIHPETDDEKSSIADHMKAEIEIPHAGELFKSENIKFYGNEADKPTFEQKKGFHQSVTYFKMISVSN